MKIFFRKFTSIITAKAVAKLSFKGFTLVEVVVAMLILSLGLVAHFSLISSVSNRVTKAKKEWENQHMITQAAEFYMLYAKEKNNKPDEVFFPYENYSATSKHLDDENNILPEEVDAEMNGWKFVPMKIDLLDTNNNVIQSITIDRILKESDL
ncbi:type II secretion system protein [Lentisphaerota bacterium WC36G]|nr:type II secretion system GspH family protein [Lentisphaerae bacterium WC36]